MLVQVLLGIELLTNILHLHGVNKKKHKYKFFVGGMYYLSRYMAVTIYDGAVS